MDDLPVSEGIDPGPEPEEGDPYEPLAAPEPDDDAAEPVNDEVKE